VAGGGRRRIPRRPVGGVPQLLQPKAVDGQRHLRPVILKPGPAHPGDVVGRYQAALAAGDAEAVVRPFEPDGYYREPIGPPISHRGAGEFRSFFTSVPVLRCVSSNGRCGR
jgi:hypothetical protein